MTNVRLTFQGRPRVFKRHLLPLTSSELPSHGLPPGYLHRSHVGQEACLDHHFRGRYTGTGAQFEFVQPLQRGVWLRSSSSIACLVKVSQSGGGGSPLRYVFLIAARLSLLTMCGWVLCWTLVNLCKKYSVLNLLFLGYP